MRFVHLADTHLGFRQYGIQEREVDFYQSFERIIDKIIEERPDFVVHSGDLFDYPKPQPRALLVAQRSFMKLREKGIPVYAITGNHDMLMRRGSLPPQVLYQHLGVKMIDHRNPFYVRDGVFIGGCPYHSKYYANALMESVSDLAKKASKYRRRLLLLHQSIEKFLPFEYELRLSDLPGSFDYYALGHLHNRISRDFGRGKIVYPGSTELWSVDEYKDYKKNGKGLCLVDLGGDQPSVQLVKMPLNREILRTQFERKDIEDVIARIKEDLSKLEEKPMLYLDIKDADDRSFVHDLLAKELGNLSLSMKINHVLREEKAEREVSKAFNIHEIIRETVEDEKKASLAIMLYSLLSMGEDEQAMKEIENFYGDLK